MDFYGSDSQQLRLWATKRGLPAFRGEQIFTMLQHHVPQCFGDISPLPKELRASLDQAHRLCPAEVVTNQESSDGTVKTLFSLADGKRVESVSIPTRTRHTICVSSQVGCAVGCTFCASGLTGVERDLQVGEIVYQVLYHHQRRPVTHVVFMGSGEPLFNYSNVLAAIRLLGHPQGLGLSRRRITVSTSGVAEKIRQLADDEPQVTLALSLHAPDDESRSRLVPLNRRWNIAALLQALDAYSQRVGRRMTFEYVLLADANMRDHHAHDLGRLARRYGAHINLIPYNPVLQTPHQRPSWDQVERFTALVREAGGHATVRGQRGADIDAACGQLVLRKKAETAV
ncbi:MAG: 23S rRNA (adenine(2503)-C(2))-methyltransferase RlmN [Planctomycetota bacterium]|nr:MAG: 23S rRNA (adenine(2503)-C(2))-methyltransferase RlmN [Planctomycetota bacterium]